MIAKTQPLLVAWLSTILVTAAARYFPGLHLDDQQALYLAGGLFTVATAVAHRFVTPTAEPRAADGMPLIRAADGAKQSDAAKQSAPPPPSRIADERPQSQPRRPTG
jgi:hypothetical protein